MKVKDKPCLCMERFDMENGWTCPRHGRFSKRRQDYGSLSEANKEIRRLRKQLMETQKELTEQSAMSNQLFR